ncbi:hypothetical protein BP5796_03489 [Coleophoma crateriformis]|uniref:Uncharacterized protein n=1 Tax=Coleophoma crateriformis TaxID=565419 RepID=A0A3D8SN99_9HELO|nr:hypothetical protein BP5796_03489 [Coleophoma crateriformis]
MASILKRKGGPFEAVDSPKRVKSANPLKPAAKLPFSTEAGWDAAFKVPREQDLAVVDRVGEDKSEAGKEGSPEAEDFEDFARKQEAEKAAKIERSTSSTPWKISEPIAGRLIDVDPVFSADEKFLIVATRVSLHVYSTASSLLTKTIRLNIDFQARPTARIIAYSLSPTSADHVWVACSDGAIYHINWSTGAGESQYWGISSTGCIHMTVASMESAGRRRDVVLTTESRKDNGWRITAHELASPDGPIATVARTIYTSTQRISFLKTTKEGSVIVAASENRVLLGILRSTEFNTVDKIRYEFRVFESSDMIASLDVRSYDRATTAGQKPPSKQTKVPRKIPVVDVVVGDVKGSIFVHNDLLSNLIQVQAGSSQGISLLPRKLHWHRQAVYSVKWSLDGNYIISGGSETTLVLWQLDTGKQQMLPHMSATLENIVVSPTGSSYAVKLADNSAMVISTAELKPTANIAGIQAPVIQYEAPLAASVRRVKEEAWSRALMQHTPAVINPHVPSQLLLGVGQTQEVSPIQPTVLSAPFLQTFDLASGHHVSRQAFARTNITNKNIAPNAHRLSEPRITHMKISSDGVWLATVDEWLPPKTDLEYLGHPGKDAQAEREKRREVFLKFWKWNEETKLWELVSRIDAPHTSRSQHRGAGKVLDLAVDLSSSRFATIGEDGFVRTWAPTTRKRDGVIVRSKDGAVLRNWNCQHAISLGKFGLEDEPTQVLSNLANGCVAFSEDGSTLAAACGNSENNLLHLIHSETGSIRLSRSELFSGDIIKIGFLKQDLITLSDILMVYDVVADAMRYSLVLGEAVTSLSTEQKVEMMHLSIDHRASTFATALPGRIDGPHITDLRKINLQSQFSELAVFSPNFRGVLLKQTFSTLITAIVPAADSEGYIILDSAAEVRTIIPQGKQAITSLAQPTSALHLDTEEPVVDLLQLVKEVEDEAEDVEESLLQQDKDEEEEETHVVTQQQLSDIFDVGPAFALPSMEDMFYQVAGLFSGKTVGVA